MKTNTLPSMKLKFGTPSILKFFRSTESIDFDKEMRRLEKEKRLEIVKRESSVWKERREQRALQHVAKKWLMD